MYTTLADIPSMPENGKQKPFQTPESLRDAYARAGLLSWAALVPACLPKPGLANSARKMPPSPFAASPYSPSGVPLPSFSDRHPPLRVSTARHSIPSNSSPISTNESAGQSQPQGMPISHDAGNEVLGRLAVGAPHHQHASTRQLLQQQHLQQQQQQHLCRLPASSPAVAAAQQDNVQQADAIDQNPFSESFGRPSGIPSDPAPDQSSAGLHTAAEPSLDADEEPDQNPFAAFITPRQSRPVAPQLQLPSEPSPDDFEKIPTQQARRAAGATHQPKSELGGSPGAAVVLDCSLKGIEVRVPYDQDPGAAIRFTELWAKAFQQVI